MKTEPSPIDIRVKTTYLPEQSSPEQERYVFAYTITIQNRGMVPATLVSRHWIITDGDGRVQEVEGEGVVGEQPTLEPGSEYSYTSGVVLDTPVGTMEGSYHMVTEDSLEFDAPIPLFTLAPPHALH